MEWDVLALSSLTLLALKLIYLSISALLAINFYLTYEIPFLILLVLGWIVILFILFFNTYIW